MQSTVPLSVHLSVCLTTVKGAVSLKFLGLISVPMVEQDIIFKNIKIN